LRERVTPRNNDRPAKERERERERERRWRGRERERRRESARVVIRNY